MILLGLGWSEDDALHFTEEFLFCTECKASTYSQYDGSRFVDLGFLFIDFFGALFVLNFAGGGHIEF